MAPKDDTVEKKLARLASAAHGIVTRKELLAEEISSDEIKQRLQTGALMAEHWGVYRVGHRAPSLEATYMAAVKACGKGAVLSGRAAAYLLGLIRGAPPPPEVTAPERREVRGVRTRRGRAEAMTHRGIPVTTVPRTLVDIAATLSLHALSRACHEAGVKYGTTPRHVDEVLNRRPNARGAGNLRAVMRGDVHVTLSRLERRFLRRLKQAGLPLPRTNRSASGRRVDCRWADRKLTVELDSYTYHRSRYAFEQDRRREREAYARGDDFRRYTWGDVFELPHQMMRELEALLR